jgi:hypothetical protein
MLRLKKMINPTVTARRRTMQIDPSTSGGFDTEAVFCCFVGPDLPWQVRRNSVQGIPTN